MTGFGGSTGSFSFFLPLLLLFGGDVMGLPSLSNGVSGGSSGVSLGNKTPKNKYDSSASSLAFFT